LKRNLLIVGLIVSLFGIFAVVNAIEQVETVEREVLERPADVEQIAERNLIDVRYFDTERSAAQLTYFYSMGLFATGIIISLYAVLEDIKKKLS